MTMAGGRTGGDMRRNKDSSEKRKEGVTFRAIRISKLTLASDGSSGALVGKCQLREV